MDLTLNNNFKSIIKGIINLLTIILTALLFITVILIFFVTVIQVFFRYVLNSPLSWTEEFVRYTHAWMIFIGAALSTKDGTHIKLDYFMDKFPKKIQKIIDFLMDSGIIIVCLILIYAELLLAKSQLTFLTAALRIPMAYVTFSIAFGSFFIIVFTIYRFFNVDSSLKLGDGL